MCYGRRVTLLRSQTEGLPLGIISSPSGDTCGRTISLRQPLQTAHRSWKGTLSKLIPDYISILRVSISPLQLNRPAQAPRGFAGDLSLPVGPCEPYSQCGRWLGLHNLRLKSLWGQPNYEGSCSSRLRPSRSGERSRQPEAAHVEAAAVMCCPTGYLA
jgi:hypothetical protein